MADIPFAVDIKQFDPEGNESVMWHVRGVSIDQFIRNLQDLRARVPAVAHLVAFSTAQVREELTSEAARRQENARRAAASIAAAETAKRPTPISSAPSAALPKCPEHGRAAWSKFYTGLFCSATMADKRKCSWKHECSADCGHPEQAAAS